MRGGGGGGGGGGRGIERLEGVGVASHGHAASVGIQADGGLGLSQNIWTILSFLHRES